MDHVRDSLSGQAGLLTQLLTLAMEPHLARVGMTLPQFELLSAVRTAGTKATQAEVARRLDLAPATLSEAVKNAVGKDFLEQVPHPRDSRAKVLRLTEHGRSALTTVLRAVSATERAMLTDVDRQDLERALETLQRANRNLARALQPKSRRSS